MVAIRALVHKDALENVVSDWIVSNFFEDIELGWLSNIVDLADSTIRLSSAIELGPPALREHVEYFNEFDTFDIFIEV